MCKKIMVSTVLIAVAFGSGCGGGGQIKTIINNHPVVDAYDGWQLGVMSYTFKNFSVMEAIDKTHSLGLNSIDFYLFGPNKGQFLWKQPAPKDDMVQPDPRFHYTMADELKQILKSRLEFSGLRIGNCYLSNFWKDQAELSKIFEFANEIGIDTFVCEPKVEQLDMLEKLGEKYKVRIALHNHPTEPGYAYGEPDNVMKLLKGRNKWMGTCADTGHWMRSGIDPVEALKKYKGRLFCLHLKDLNKFNDRDAHDVPWGTGKGNFKAILAELHRQNFKGVISIEYEYNWNNSMPELRQCVAQFNKLAAEFNPTGWQTLITDDLSNFVYKKGTWIAEENVLTWQDGGHIWTKEKYGDFILDLEFKLARGTNSGIFIRNIDNRKWSHRGLEVQILDSDRRDKRKGGGKDSCGAIYDCVAPDKSVVYPPGIWNRITITWKANKINVVLNSKQIIDMDVNQWDKPHKNPDGTQNKFPIAFKTMHKTGYIGFQDHGDKPVWYRNIRIKRLN